MLKRRFLNGKWLGDPQKDQVITLVMCFGKDGDSVWIYGLNLKTKIKEKSFDLYFLEMGLQVL